ncbi:MAG TPA: 16S rRNA (cytosine(1402)-N(4))-methyltransferase RsmH [Bacteroidia bacterium]|jgi:16S rRNA (cytosine1402-N4)-methyltransferase
MTKSEYHNPVLLKECIEGLNIRKDGVYADVTFGGGGHSREILKHLGDKGRLFGFDQDEEAYGNALPDERFVLVKENFRNLEEALRERGVERIDGLLADLGVSSHQFDTAGRGFSIRFDAALDMRMSKTLKHTAADVLNDFSEQDLKKVFREYGEIENAAQLARTIFAERKKARIRTVSELKNVIAGLVRKGKENQYLAQVFQALRIEVNDELNALKELLEQSARMIKGGGRLVVMSYHSLEDRLVKNYIRDGKFEGDADTDFYGNRIVPFKAINRKPIEPSDQEIRTNNRARSAKLRIAEKT